MRHMSWTYLMLLDFAKNLIHILPNSPTDTSISSTNKKQQ